MQNYAVELGCKTQIIAQFILFKFKCGSKALNVVQIGPERAYQGGLDSVTYA